MSQEALEINDEGLVTKVGECCHRCGGTDFSPNIEAFEICGQLTCDECAEEIFEENSQFGVGA